MLLYVIIQWQCGPLFIEPLFIEFLHKNNTGKISVTQGISFWLECGYPDPVLVHKPMDVVSCLCSVFATCTSRVNWK